MFSPILDFIHALSYVFAATTAGRPFKEGWACYLLCDDEPLEAFGKRGSLGNALTAKRPTAPCAVNVLNIEGHLHGAEPMGQKPNS